MCFYFEEYEILKPSRNQHYGHVKVYDYLESAGNFNKDMIVNMWQHCEHQLWCGNRNTEKFQSFLPLFKWKRCTNPSLQV